MSKVMENLAGMKPALALAAVLVFGAASQAPAAQFRIAPDGEAGVWVLETSTGALALCRAEAPSGPKVIDVFGGEGMARPERAYRPVPECDLVAQGRVPAPAMAARLVPSAFAEGAYGDIDAVRGYGLIGFDGPEGSVNILRPRYVDIYLR